MQKVSEFLIGAKKLIEDPTNWTQGWFAKSNLGNHVQANSERAVCFCSLGALERFDGKELPLNKRHPLTGEKYLSRYAQDELENVMGQAVEDFNDENSHSLVMEKWEEAIRNAQEKEAQQ